jgi:hypothetical protein
LFCETEPGKDRAGDGACLFLERRARGSESYFDGALVVPRTRTRHQAGSLQALEERRKRPVADVQHESDFLDEKWAALPQHPHHDVLRIGEVDIGEETSVHAVHRPPSHVERQAEVVTERDVGGVHARQISLCRLPYTAIVSGQDARPPR